MTNGKEVQIEKRPMVVNLINEVNLIAELLMIYRFRAKRQLIMLKFQASNSIVIKKLSGKSRKTLSSEDRFLVRRSRHNRRLAVLETTADVNLNTDVLIGFSTVKRKFQYAGLNDCISVQKPLLQSISKRKKL